MSGGFDMKAPPPPKGGPWQTFGALVAVGVFVWSAAANGFGRAMLELPIGLALLTLAGTAVLAALTIMFETVCGGITRLARLAIAAYPYRAPSPRHPRSMSSGGPMRRMGD